VADLTLDQVKQALPVNMKSSATQTLTDQINNLVQDPVMAEHIREHFITYAVVLQEGKWGIDAYMNAIQYTTYKMMGYSNQEAYFRTFPTRHAEFIAKGTTSKDISAYVSQYHKGKLVNAIMEKALIPIHVLYLDVHHQAIRVQADLMQNAQSEKVRMEAANSLLTHLAVPKQTGPAVAIQINNNAEMDAMQRMLRDLGERQLQLINSGVSAQELAAQRLIEAEPIPAVKLEGEA
jgi:hypothetical protein